MIEHCPTERRVVDDRVFLLGLDYLYREAMKRHERTELLVCARRVAAGLNVGPADVPIEGYYDEDSSLEEYFRLVRALQEVDEARAVHVDGLSQFQRLLAITSSRLFGHPQRRGKLLPVGRDALSEALLRTRPTWTLATITAAARQGAVDTDDFSLVGLAARIEDAVVLTALRESVVLYGEKVYTSAPAFERAQFVWHVSDTLAEQAARFIDLFNALLEDHLPPPEAEQAGRYWQAYHRNEIMGRCAHLGVDDGHVPALQYHWAICRAPDGDLMAHEFWRPEIWTTSRYRAAQAHGDVRADL